MIRRTARLGITAVLSLATLSACASNDRPKGDLAASKITTIGVNRKTEEPSTISWLQVCRIEDDRIAEMWMLYALGLDWSKD